jgi:hypothetical protein
MAYIKKKVIRDYHLDEIDAVCDVFESVPKLLKLEPDSKRQARKWYAFHREQLLETKYKKVIRPLRNKWK